MTRNLIIASVALGMIAVVALAVFATGTADRGQGTVSPSVAAVECAPAPAADAGLVSPPVEGASETEPAGEIKTGCGRPEPCPGRSCEGCPHNRLL